MGKKKGLWNSPVSVRAAPPPFEAGETSSFKGGLYTAEPVAHSAHG